LPNRGPIGPRLSLDSLTLAVAKTVVCLLGFQRRKMRQDTHEDIRRARRVAVGSTNPVKLAAARAVITRVAPQAAVEAIAVPSGVRDQPFGDDETIAGALERARAARAALDADFGVGLEGGVVEMPDGSMRTCAWAAVVSRSGRHGVGGSLAMPLPDAVAKLIRGGMELGHAMDALTGDTNTKHKGGAVAILTAGLVDRQAAYEVLVAYALTPLLPVT
jgi:inosine/xanthosine triphosphatase